MASYARFYLLNKKQEWKEHGYSYGISYSGDSITTSPKENNISLNKAIYISKGIDSMANGTTWDKITFESDVPMDTQIVFRYFTADNNIIEFNGNKMTLDELVDNDSILYESKVNILDNLWQNKYDNPKSILLHKVKGRYIYFMIELYTYSSSKPLISSIKIEFPKDSFIRYLPEVFERAREKSDFLVGYMAMFQNIYIEIEEKIDNISDLFNPEMLDEDKLRWLAEFLNIDNADIWEKEKLKLLIKNFAKLYEKRGTKDGLEQIIEMYTGEKPTIIEPQVIERIREYQKDDDTMQRLYSDNPYTFTVIVREEKINKEKEYNELQRIINSFKPAHTICRLVALKQVGVIGGHAYLGINSTIYQNKYLRIDGKSTIPYDSILTDKDTN